jgi:hypothetical protein
MRIIVTTVLFAAGLTAALPAAAVENGRVSNAKYVEAVRCQGLAKAGVLGAVDTSAIDAFVRDQAGARDMKTERSARAARRDAQRVDGDMSALAARASQTCAAWLSPASLARGGGSAAR